MTRSYLLILTALIFGGSGFKEPVYILSVGDSITHGGKKVQQEYTYRLPLQMLLHENSIAYDFIGSRQQGLDGGVSWPDVANGVAFDADHEGYYGYKTADVCRKVKEAFTAYKLAPDIVLIHLGTNDQQDGDFENKVGAPLRDLIRFIRIEESEGCFFARTFEF
jgi:lysophospholipase L1-like esterase